MTIISSSAKTSDKWAVTSTRATENLLCLHCLGTLWFHINFPNISRKVGYADSCWKSFSRKLLSGRLECHLEPLGKENVSSYLSLWEGVVGKYPAHPNPSSPPSRALVNISPRWASSASGLRKSVHLSARAEVRDSSPGARDPSSKFSHSDVRVKLSSTPWAISQSR